MTSCNWVKERLLDFPEYLSEEERAQVNAHLRICPLCQQELHELNLLARLLHPEPSTVPQTLHESLVQEFRRKFSPGTVQPQRRWYLYSIAAAALIVVSLTLFYYVSFWQPFSAGNLVPRVNPPEGLLWRTSVSSYEPKISPEGSIARVQGVSTHESDASDTHTLSPVAEDSSGQCRWQTSMVTYDPRVTPEGGVARIDRGGILCNANYSW